MTTKDEALKLALEALEFSSSYLNELSGVLKFSKKAKPGSTAWHVQRAIKACREALAQKDEREPVAYRLPDVENSNLLCRPVYVYFSHDEFHPTEHRRGVLDALEPLYTCPPKREPLTDEQIDDIWNRYSDEMGSAVIHDAYEIAREIERAHGIGGEA